MKNINAVCRKVAKLTDAELAEADQITADQIGYCHPLKIASSRRTQGAGRHNQRVLEKLKELRSTILAGA